MFRKEDRKILLDLSKQIQDIVPKELSRLRFIEQEYVKLNEYLSYLGLGVKDVKRIENDSDGKSYLRIIYKIPSVDIEITDTNELTRNERFRAINLLEVLSAEDYDMIQKEINKLKKYKKN